MSRDFLMQSLRDALGILDTDQDCREAAHTLEVGARLLKKLQGIDALMRQFDNAADRMLARKLG